MNQNTNEIRCSDGSMKAAVYGCKHSLLHGAPVGYMHPPTIDEDGTVKDAGEVLCVGCDASRDTDGNFLGTLDDCCVMCWPCVEKHLLRGRQ